MRRKTISYRIRQRADAVDHDFDFVSRLHWRDAGRGSGGDQVAGIERHGCGDIAEQNINREDEVACVAVLLHFAIETRFDGEPVGRIDFIGQEWTDGTECIEALCA
jgi:hypothetical protein